MREATARGLEAARTRTMHLTDFDDSELTTQHSPLMSPLVWDLAHIGQQEDLWLPRGGNAAAQGILSRQVEKPSDAFVHPRASRVPLPLPPVPRRLKSGPGIACTILTCDQAAPSSSAKIIGNAVRTPCPISDLPRVSVTAPFSSIRIHPLG